MNGWSLQVLPGDTHIYCDTVRNLKKQILAIQLSPSAKKRCPTSPFPGTHAPSWLDCRYPDEKPCQSENWALFAFYWSGADNQKADYRVSDSAVRPFSAPHARSFWPQDRHQLDKKKGHTHS